MTDDQQWHAPGQAAVPPPTSPLQAGPPIAAPPPPAAAPGWTPPPKPGLIPLRPMTFGTILGASFQTLRRNPAATLLPALILSLAVGAVQLLGSVNLLTNALGLSGIDTASGSPLDPYSTVGPLIGFAATALGSALLSLIVTAIIDAIVTVQVASSTLGARLRLRGLWRRLRGRRGAVVGWAALTGAAVLLTWVVVVLILIGIGLTGPAGAVVAVLLTLVLGLGILLVFCWLWVKLGFVPSAIVLERASIRTAMRRSWRLTKGAFWRTFGIRLLVAFMFAVASAIITAPISFALSLFDGVLLPNGDTQASGTTAAIIAMIASQAVTAVFSAVALVITTATTALLYLDQRMRTEGLDLDLARFVEQRAAGAQGLADPYLPKPAA